MVRGEDIMYINSYMSKKKAKKRKGALISHAHSGQYFVPFRIL